MTWLFYGILLPLSSFCVHVIVWRLLPNRRSYANLAVVFLSVNLGLLIVLWTVLGLEAAQLLAITLFSTSISLAYFIVYSAIEYVSPTLYLLGQVETESSKSGQAATMGHIRKKMAELDSISKRISELVNSGTLRRSDKELVLNNRPLLFTLVTTYRKLLGRMNVKGG
jgi:hypothetical protein